MASTASAELEYFGFYSTPEYWGESKDFSNIVFMTAENIKIDVFNLWKAVIYRQKAIIAITPIFLEYNPDMEKKISLRTDYRERWDKYASIIAPYASYIAAFYSIDEPYWNGENMGLSKAEIKYLCEVINTEIKAKFPNIPIAVIFTAAEIDDTLEIPAGYDWVGFDYYGTFDPILPIFNILKNKLLDGQKIILVADGVAFGTTPPSLEEQEAWVVRAQQYYELASSDPAVVAMIPFLWHSIQGPYEYLIGTRDIESVKEKYIRIGTEITRKINVTTLPSCTTRFSPSKISVGERTDIYWTSKGDDDGKIMAVCVDANGESLYGFLDTWGNITLPDGYPKTIACTLTVENEAGASVCSATLTVSEVNNYDCPNCKIAVIGDSLSMAGVAWFWPWKLADEGFSVSNCAYSGARFDLIADYIGPAGTTQMQCAVEFQPDIVIIALGGNDLLTRDSDLRAAKANAKKVFDVLRAQLPNAKLVYGSELVFDPNCTAKINVCTLPYFASSLNPEDPITLKIRVRFERWQELDKYIKEYADDYFTLKIYLLPTLDGLHPNEEGQNTILGTVMKFLNLHFTR